MVGPLFQVAKTVGGEVQRQAANKLREQFAEPAMAQVQAHTQAPGTPSRTASYSSALDTDGEDVKQELRSRQL